MLAWPRSVFLPVVFSLLWPPVLAAQTLRVGYYPVRDNKLALWVAQDAGIFKKYGLDVALTLEPRGTDTVDGVIAKKIDIGVMGIRDAVARLSEGADLAFIASLAANPFNFLARADIKSPQDLIGKKIWTARTGSGPDVATRLVLRHLGLDSEKDVELVSYGDNPAVGVQWIFEGKAAASLANRGALKDLQRQGKKITVLADFIDSGLYVTAADVLVRRDWLASNRAAAKAFLKAVIEATAYAKSHKAFTEATFKKYLLKEFATGEESKFEDYVLGVLPQKPYPLTKALEFAIEEKSGNRPFPGKAQDFVDDSLLREIEQDGLFDRLYR